jgi:5,10-methylenetetrahydromethanopterin reductase
MHGTPVGPASESDRALLRRVHDAYDMNRHARAGSPQAALLDDDFAARFAVYGPPVHVVARLRELLALGLERLMVVGASVGADRDAARASEARFVREVLPALRP